MSTKVRRGVHFNEDVPLMFSNKMNSETSKKEKEREKQEIKREEEIQRIQRENQILKRQLSRRWSSRSSCRGSISSRIVVAEVFSDEEENDDDSLLLLRDNSTLHGLRDLLTSSSNQFRLIWIILLIIATMLTLHGVWQIYMEFKLRRVVVSYFIQEASSLQVPDIVICPFNRFNRSYLEHLNVSAGLSQHLELSYPFPTIHSFQERTKQETVLNMDQYEYELEILLNKLGNMSYTEFLKKASLGCTAFFQNKERCEDITELMTSAGKCFRLKGPEQFTGGYGYGDQIVLKLPQNLYNPGANQMLNNGIILKLAEQGKGIDHDLTFIPAGVHAIVPLTATRYEFMNDPPRYECELNLDGKYSRVWCFEHCFVSEAEDACDCSPAAASNPRRPLCTTKQLYHCLFTHLFGPGENARMKRCKAKCKSPCTYWQYQKSVSYATFPGPAAKFFVANQSEWEELKSTIVLDVYFALLDYTMIKHVVAMPLQSVIAQIGGQFSLWAGGSLISLCQIIIYLSRYFYYKCVHRKKREVRIKETSPLPVNYSNDGKQPEYPRI